MRYGSVCSGIEAASVAWQPLGWEPAFFSEIEPFPSAVLAERFGSNLPGEPYATNGVPNYGDIKEYERWPDHGQKSERPIDLLVGGTPCQSFSIAGLRGGLGDERGNLTLTYLQIADRYRPRWLVWENVPGVFSSFSAAPVGEDIPEDGWEGIEESDFACFLEGLQELGYHAAWRVLDAQFVRVDGFLFAVPQRRRRVFVVGYLGDWRCAASVLFELESLQGHPSPIRKAGQGIAGTFEARSNAGGGFGTDFECAGGVIAGSVSSKWAKGSGGPAGDEHYNLVAFDSKASGQHGFGAGDTSPALRSMSHSKSHANAGGQVAIAVTEEPYTLTERGRTGGQNLEFRQDGTANAILTPNGGRGGMGLGAIASSTAVRRLMPVECERLQGFPDDHTRIAWRGKPPEDCPDGPRYRAIGNSMAFNVMRWIGRRIEHVENLRMELVK